MRNVFFISSFLFLISQGCLLAQSETRFYAESSAREVAVGEAVKITFILENGKNSSRFTPPDWEAAGFLVLGSSQSSNISIMNGQTSASASYHFTITPMEEGAWTVPSVSIKNGETELHTEPIMIQALPNADGIRPANPKRAPAPTEEAPRKRTKTIKI